MNYWQFVGNGVCLVVISNHKFIKKIHQSLDFADKSSVFPHLHWPRSWARQVK